MSKVLRPALVIVISGAVAAIVAFAVVEWRGSDTEVVTIQATAQPIVTPSLCEQLRDNLAAAQTEIAARVFIRRLSENGC